MNDVLLTVSGNIPDDLEEQIERGERPLTDYMAMAKTFNADLIDYKKARAITGGMGRLLEKLAGPNAVLAWACYQLRHQYNVIFTDGEQVGLPLAFFLKYLGGKKRPQHLMIVHILSVGKKMILIDRLGLQSHIDIFFVYATRQQAFIRERWHLPAERVIFTPFMVDSNFFHSSKVDESDLLPMLREVKKPIISSVGLEFRDYPTLIEAVRDLDVRVVLAAASPWSKREDTTKDQPIPENIIVRRFSQYELRQVYHESDFVVMPLYNVEFQAGVTAILEAMSMEKALVCTRTLGQTDVVIDQETGIYVSPSDPQAMRDAIQRLLENPEVAHEMGKAGRQRIEQEMSLKCYVERFNHFVQHARKVALSQ